MTQDTTAEVVRPRFSADPPPPVQGRMYVSYTQISTYSGCPLKWALGRVYEKRDAAVPLVLGSWWHAVRAAYNITKGEADDTLLDGMCPDSLGVKTWWGAEDLKLDPGIGVVGVLMKAAEHWGNHPTSTVAALFEERFVEKHGAPLHVYLKHMTLMWDVYRPEDLGPVLGVEVHLVVDLEAPSGPVRVVGYVDLIDQASFGVRVLDLKTTEYVPASTSRMLYEQQLSVYAYAWSRAIEEEGAEGGPLTELGPISEVGYEYVATRNPGEPKLTKTGALSKTPKYPLSTYLSWTRTVGVGEDDKEVTRLRAPEVAEAWVALSTRMTNPSLVQNHLTSIVDISEEMRRTWARWLEQGTAPQHLSKDCSYCPFWGICADQLEGYQQDLRKIDEATLDSLGLQKKGRSGR